MQLFHTLLVLLASTLATAQLPNIPSCSINCFISAFQHDGCSQLTDFACHCQKPDLPTTITPCVQKACNVADQSAVSSEVVRQCSIAGHPISIPPVGGGLETTTLSMPRTSTTDGEAVSSSAASATLPTVSSSGAASSSKVSHSSSASASASASSSHAPSTPGSHSQSGHASSTASPSSPLSTGSASTIKAGVAGAIVIAAAAVCVL
ncbi:CFEM-domain-containing protein [Aspergillus costaricaensis CBS 115574]|uniref:CFEM-domain-containing protein n=1 Tax=Aspergillus costaricaensis CBS 115574 TaxID=1448317 RepID=A0ACD1I738_9EURO|nr:CFEM-domain-containing protein [Aspergillus costaricaensis CBS 115574]RAK86310.1 CFEM-domain-containing protein [Aspergillus costaricaensis CBS 115574]